MKKLLSALTIIFGFLVLYIPIGVIIAYSFNDSKRNVVWRGFTFKYYALALGDVELLWALLNSLTIATATGILSLVLGASSGYVLWRFRFPLRHTFDALLSLPIVVPEICMGIAMMVFFSHLPWFIGLRWPFDLIPIIIAHTAFSFPFVTIMVRSSLENFNFELVEAAIDLGAKELGIFGKIILPHVRPSLVAGFLLASSLSLDDFLITFFTTSPGTATLPLKIYSMVRFAVSPEVNAISSILIFVTFALAFVGIVLQGRSASIKEERGKIDA